MPARATTNVLGVFWGRKYQIQQMLAQDNPGGAIVNLASMAGLGGVRYAANYSATKHAVVALTKSAALEYATDNIRINAVAPAAIKTDILNAAIEAGTWDESAISPLQPMNRMGRPRRSRGGHNLARLTSSIFRHRSCVQRRRRLPRPVEP